MFRGWAKISACCLQVTLSCAVLCRIVSLQYILLSRSSFLVIWYPSGDTRGPSIVFEAVDMPCPGPFHFSHSVDCNLHAGLHGLPFHADQCGLERGTEIGVPNLGSCVSALIVPLLNPEQGYVEFGAPSLGSCAPSTCPAT